MFVYRNIFFPLNTVDFFFIIMELTFRKSDCWSLLNVELGIEPG